MINMQLNCKYFPTHFEMHVQTVCIFWRTMVQRSFVLGNDVQRSFVLVNDIFGKDWFKGHLYW